MDVVTVTINIQSVVVLTFFLNRILVGHFGPKVAVFLMNILDKWLDRKLHIVPAHNDS